MNSALAQSIADLSNRWRSRFSRLEDIVQIRSSPARRARREVGVPLSASVTVTRSSYRNFRGRSGGEIDVVCRDNDTLVFVEVKTRGARRFRPARSKRWIEKNRNAFRAVRWPGSECWIIPTFFSDSMSLKSSLRTTPNRVSN